MAETQTVIIEFITETGQLDSAIDQLEKTGAIDSKMASAFKATNAEIGKQAAEIKKTAAATVPLKKNLEDVNKATKKFTQDFMTGFNEGVLETLKEAGVSAEEFNNALEKGSDKSSESTKSLKQELKGLTDQLAQMALAGEDNTAEFSRLEQRAGEIKDAIRGVGEAISRVGDGELVIKGIGEAAQGVAGGFALAQGLVGVFGEESEELQQTLLKVNSAMAVLQGLQSISAVLQKESNLLLLVNNRQRLITNAQLAIENGLQSQSVIVRFAAAGAQKALNLAMAANPVGILVVAIAGLIGVLATYGRAAAAARQQTSNLNVALGAGAKNFEERAEAIKATGENLVNALENQGAVQSRISAQQLETEKQLADNRKARLKELQDEQANNLDADLEKRQEVAAEIRKLEDEIFTDGARARNLEAKQHKILNEERLKNTIAGIESELSAAAEGSQKQLNLQRRLIAARTALELNADGLLENERAVLIAKGNQERLELEAAFNKRRIDLQLQVIEAQLVNVREGSQEELDLKKKQLSLQAQSEITSTKLSEKEKQAIISKGFQDRLKLQREFNERITREAIEGQISRNEAEISQIKTNDDDRLILQIANIELAAAAEVNAAKGNASKIKEINAKRDADILAVRKKFIDDAAQYEIDIRTADNGPSSRALQRTINDERKGLEVRKAAIRQLADFQIANIDIQLRALEEEKEKRLISERDYILKYKQLQDKKKEISEKTEEDITAKTEEQNRLRQEVSFAALNAIATVISDINANQTEQENQRLEAEREKVAELLEAGAITEKEAIARNKRLDNEEKKLKREQAKREKNLAIFNAVINTALAITKALSSAPPPYNIILAAISAALGAAQIAAISSRPLPRFGHGKKSGYEGPAEIGETGAELYEQNGRMYIADKKQIVWLGAKDKVYNPTETKEMLMPVVDKQLMQWQAPAQKTDTIDYDKLGKAVGKHIKIPGFNIDEEGFKIWEQQGQNRQNYMDKRYSSK